MECLSKCIQMRKTIKISKPLVSVACDELSVSNFVRFLLEEEYSIDFKLGTVEPQDSDAWSFLVQDQSCKWQSF